MITAVIGHGRSPEGRNWYRKIDRKCDRVIRMWDWHWQDWHDYGTKYDFGFFELYPATYVQFRRHNQKQPAMGWLGSLLRHGDKIVPPKGTHVIDQRRWVKYGKVMGGIGASGNLEYTRGTLAALWAIEASEPNDHVVLVGFDNVKAGIAKNLEDAFSKDYRQNVGTFSFEKYVGGVTKFGNHDYAIEYPVMAKVAEMNGVNLRFAEDIWTVKPL